ncbi:helix-turn-helix domain-containing protein [Herbaspirillum sp. GCM10030257]|uniref:helix-turn-helix domain-containing protein n=1 Tax=Herbaspirillum sp. GCM10030257 TaxID=3273393 RepID=UPI00361262EA
MQSVTPQNYNPNDLFDALIKRLQLSSDNALSKRLSMARHVVENIRRGRIPLAASLLLAIQQQTGISIDELRRLMGDRRAKFRLACQQARCVSRTKKP